MNENYPVLKDQTHLRQRTRTKHGLTKRTAVILASALLLTGIAAYMLFGNFDFGVKNENNDPINENASENEAPNDVGSIYDYDYSAVPSGEIPVVPVNNIKKNNDVVSADLPKINGKILVVSTHSFEAYLESEMTSVSADTSFVGGDHTVTNIGRYLADLLRFHGLDAAFLDVEAKSARGAYAAAAEKISEYAEENEVGCIIDVRRASLLGENTEVLRPVISDGGLFAQMNFVVSSETESPGKMAGYAKNVSDKMNGKHADISAVSSSAGVLGQNLCDLYFTVELGAAGNSYGEAKATAFAFAEAFASAVKQD